MSAQEPVLQIGDPVTHKFHGEGTVKSVKESAGGVQCFVEFAKTSQWCYASMLKPARPVKKETR